MDLWLLLAGAFVVQEPLSTTFIILEAIRAGYPLFLIHLLWFLVTLTETSVGYLFGTWLCRRGVSKKVNTWIEKHTKTANSLIGASGKRVALAFITILTLPFFTGFLAPWLAIPLSDALIFSQIGSFVWYVSVWIGVYSANQFSSTIETSVIIITLVSLVFTIPLAFWRKKHTRT